MAVTKFSRMKALQAQEPTAHGVKLLDEEPNVGADTRRLLRTALETAWANPGRWVEVSFSGEEEVARIRPAFSAIMGPGNCKRRGAAMYIRSEHVGD